MDQIYATLLSDVIGADVINSTLQELEQNYPKLYAQLSELVLPDGSNAGEIKDYSLHLVDAYLKLKQSELYRNPVLLRVLRSLGPVAKSYELSGQEDYVLHFDTALTVTLMALMCGLKDLGHVVAYSNYANQYLQLLLPHMVHPRYRISLPNCRSAMRLVNCEMMERFYTNFFTRAKVATKLVAPSVLKALQPNIKLAGALATLNANYIKESLKDCYKLPIDTLCKHEFVFDGLADKSTGITTLDVAKRLLDYGFHAPTVYFPLLFHQSIMIEPTETESKETLDAFIAVMRKIAEEAVSEPDTLREAPHSTPVSRLDETTAAKNPVLTYFEM